MRRSILRCASVSWARLLGRRELGVRSSCADHLGLRAHERLFGEEGIEGGADRRGGRDGVRSRRRLAVGGGDGAKRRRAEQRACAQDHLPHAKKLGSALCGRQVLPHSLRQRATDKALREATRDLDASAQNWTRADNMRRSYDPFVRSIVLDECVPTI
eukprot:4673067-Pleurochrysis_carterae.AAC.1